MPRPRHFVNTKTPGASLFVTLRALDFAHVFARSEVRDAVRDSIYTQCRQTDSILHAYVVMVNHAHFVVRLHPEVTGPSFVHSFKNDSGKSVLPMLTREERALLSQQTGLNKAKLWARSFRSFPICSEAVLFQKIKYVHLNPVRAKLCGSSDEYRHSSAHLFEQGLWNPYTGLRFE